MTSDTIQTTQAPAQTIPSLPRILLLGADTLYFSFAVSISAAIRALLMTAKEAAKEAAKARQVHCPEWLGARVLPNGAQGGYSVLIETDNFTVKVLGDGIPNRPGLYIEMRSHFLHTHEGGEVGACEEAIAWVREHLLADQDAEEIAKLVSFKTAKLSRGDLHVDWQGGYAPSLVSVPDDLGRFIRPGKTKWGFYGQGHAPTGYTFGKGKVHARLYNKTTEATEKGNDAYFALLVERNGDVYDHALAVWRIEFQLNREGAKGFKLYAAPEIEDDDLDLDAELAAEDLEHVGTLPRFFAHRDQIWRYLTQHWLRLVVDDGTHNRSRWPLDPTWAAIQEAYTTHAPTLTTPLEEDGRVVVRGLRYSGKNRVLRRLMLGVTASLEVEDASPVSTALATLHAWADRLVDKEQERLDVRKARALAQYGRIPAWIERGMGRRYERAEQVRLRVQMLLGICGAKGVLPLEHKPAHSVGDLLLQHLDDLEQEADDKGGVQAVLRAHFARMFKVAAPASLFAVGGLPAA